MYDAEGEAEIAISMLERFLRSDLVPSLEDLFKCDQLPEKDLRLALGRLAPFGVGNLRIPAEFGGAGLDLVTAGALHETAARYAPELSTPAFINDGVGTILAQTASPAMARHYLEPLAAGATIAALANSEPGGGSDVRSLQTKARKRGAAYLLSGRKTWITNGHYADFVLVLARTEDTGSLDLFLVDRVEHGFESRALKLAGRVTAAELLFEDVEIPEENRLTNLTGLPALLASFQSSRGFVALSAIGVAQAALDLAVDYAKHRHQFGRPIGAQQLVQSQLADSATEIEAARLLAYDMLARAQKGENVEMRGSMAKLFATEAAQRIVYRAVQIHGASGVADGMAIERLSQAVRVYPIVEGTSEIQRLIIGRALTGIDAIAIGRPARSTSKPGASHH